MNLSGLFTILELTRLEESSQGTIGILKINKQVFCYTLEPPDFENKRNRSSIPAQQYECVYHNSPRFGWTYKVLDVPERTHILFHAGNVAKHTSGCILLGQTVGKLMGDRAVLNSGKTFRAFMKRLNKIPAHLTITTQY